MAMTECKEGCAQHAQICIHYSPLIEKGDRDRAICFVDENGEIWNNLSIMQ